MTDPGKTEPFGSAGSEVDEGLRSSRPPEAFTLVRTWVIDSLGELRDLRAGLAQEVAPGSGPVPELDSVAQSMVLVASELATNSLKHAIPPTIVRLLRARDTYVLDVADHDLARTPYLAGTRSPGQGGFGLQIARRLAIDVGWYATDTTKHVWARFPAS